MVNMVYNIYQSLTPFHLPNAGVIPNVKGSKLPENHRIIVSNSLVIYGYIKGNTHFNLVLTTANQISK